MNPLDWPRTGQDIESAELKENNVYIKSARGDTWRVWINWDGQPLIELVERH